MATHPGQSVGCGVVSDRTRSLRPTVCGAATLTCRTSVIYHSWWQCLFSKGAQPFYLIFLSKAVKSATLFLKQVCQTELVFLLFHNFPHESITVHFGDVFKIYNKKILLVRNPVGNAKKNFRTNDAMMKKTKKEKSLLFLLPFRL